MHMLHNRRKAEIEILSTAKPQRRLWTLMDGPTQQLPPLLDYLLDKISDFVDVHRLPE